MPSPRRRTSSYKEAGLRFQWTRPDRRMPRASRPCARSTCIDMLFDSPPLPAAALVISGAISRAAIVTKTPIVLGRSGSVNSADKRSGFQVPSSTFAREVCEPGNMDLGTWKRGFRGIVLQGKTLIPGRVNSHLGLPYSNENASSPRRQARIRGSLGAVNGTDDASPSPAAADVQGFGTGRQHQSPRSRGRT